MSFLKNFFGKRWGKKQVDEPGEIVARIAMGAILIKHNDRVRERVMERLQKLGEEPWAVPDELLCAICLEAMAEVIDEASKWN